jgi:putative membrane protein
MAMKTNMITSIAALALVFGAAPAFAQYGGTGGTAQQPQTRQRGSTTDQGADTTRGNSQSTSTNTKTSADENFAKKAAQGGMAEVKLGQLAEERGSNPSVKNFGRRMVQDHSKANDELKSATSKESIPLPNELDKSDQATYDRLSKLSGDAFDRAYARDMVRDHSKDVSEFQKEAKNGRDDAIKNFAAQTLPTLQNHLDQARQMEQAVNQSASSAPGNNENKPSGGSSGSTYPSNNRTNPGTTSGTSSPSR